MSATSPRRRLEVERLEQRDTPSTIAPHTSHPLRQVHATVELTVTGTPEVNAKGNTVFTGTVAIMSPRLGSLTGTFTEEIGPRKLHGAVQIDATGGGNTVKLDVLDNFFAKAASGAANTHGSFDLHVHGPLTSAHGIGVANGTINTSTGAGTLHLAGLIRL